MLNKSKQFVPSRKHSQQNGFTTGCKPLASKMGKRSIFVDLILCVDYFGKTAGKIGKKFNAKLFFNQNPTTFTSLTKILKSILWLPKAHFFMLKLNLEKSK